MNYFRDIGDKLKSFSQQNEQSIPSTVSNFFQQEMPLYYTLLSVLTNKSKYMKHTHKNFNQHQWDRLVLYLFMIIQRIRIRHNFSWHALINGASTWSSKTGNIDVDLGLCLSRFSILRKLHIKYSRVEVEQMIIARLKKELICIG